jgi:dihydrodipicolinate synthase/N-acetylneuraminate lyase
VAQSSEMYTLTNEERLQCAKVVKKVAGDRGPFVTLTIPLPLTEGDAVMRTSHFLHTRTPLVGVAARWL